MLQLWPIKWAGLEVVGSHGEQDEMSLTGYHKIDLYLNIGQNGGDKLNQWPAMDGIKVIWHIEKNMATSYALSIIYKTYN